MTGRIRRSRRIVAAGVVSVGVAGIAAAAAFGHIPGVGNGLPPSTNAPDLRSATVMPGTRVRYCFDAGVAAITPAALVNPAGFFNVQTYDARRAMSPTSVTPDGLDGNCVVAQFAGVDLPQGTVGEVVPGAVRDLQQRTNDFASEPLDGSASAPTAGATTGPDLTGVDVNVSGSPKLVTYTFDENIEPGTHPGTAFGFYDNAGNRINGVGNATINGNTATVSFGDSGALTPSTTRFIADQGAVSDRAQSVNLLGGPLTTPSSPGVVAKGTSAKPEVIAAEATEPNVYRVTFSQPVVFGSAVPGRFFAVSDDGTTPPAGSSVGPTGAANSVLVTFPANVNLDENSTVKILVLANAISQSDGVTTNVTSQAATSTPNASKGFTNGPDLLAVGIDAATNRVVFKYDEAILSTASPAASAFRAVAADGTVIPAIPGSASVNGQFVTVTYPNTISTAVAFANPGNTIRDKTTRVGPHQSVSKDIQVGPAPPPPPPPTQPIGPTAPRVVPRYKVTVTIRRRGRVYSGTLKSSRKACIQGRRVILKKRGKDARYGQKKSGRTGKYSIRRKRRVGGRVYAFVTPRKTTSVNCLSRKSRTIRG